jgi:hypothetical protein
MCSMSNPCARQIKFAGKVRTFNLNDATVLGLMAADMAAMSSGASAATLRRFALEPPLAGANGPTPAACMARFINSAYSIRDIENVIGLGLIGAGVPENEAWDLVDQHVTGQPLAANALIASEVISALFVGAPTEA